jgi:hypothetical protein
MLTELNESERIWHGMTAIAVDNGHTATKSKNQAPQNLSLACPHPIFSLSSTKVLVTQNYKDSFIIHLSPQHRPPEAHPSCRIRHHRSPCQMRSPATISHAKTGRSITLALCTFFHNM